MQPATTPIWAKLPNGNTICTTHMCTLQLDHLPEKARHAHVLPHLATHSLISVVNLCNAGCEVIFNKIGCTMKHRGKKIVCGHKCTNTGLWMIPLDNTHARLTSPTITPTKIPVSTIANITHMQDTTSPGMYIQFLHQSLESPPTATLLHAPANNEELQTIPGLNATVIKKYLQHSPATDKGHLH